MRIALLLLGVLVTMVATPSEALAAPIGMCADTAQSIAAPPPMFPADDTAVENCTEDADENLALRDADEPSEGVFVSHDLPDHKVVLAPTVFAPRARSFTTPVMRRTLRLTEEHRWRGLRPPRDAAHPAP